MGISSPNVVQKEDKAIPAFMQGMQMGQMMLQQKKQMDMVQANQILQTLDKVAQTSAGGWNGLMKMEGMQDSVAGLFGKLGMSPDAATQLAGKMGDAIPTYKGAMEMSGVFQAYSGRGLEVPPEAYAQFGFKPPQGNGQTTQPEQPGVKQGQITGQTYQWQEGQEQSQQRSTTQTKQTEIQKGQTTQTTMTGLPGNIPANIPSQYQERINSLENQRKEALTEYDAAQKELTNAEVSLSSPEKRYESGAYGDLYGARQNLETLEKRRDVASKKEKQLLSQIVELEQKQELAKGYTSKVEVEQKIPNAIDIATPGTKNTVEQVQNIQSGQWVVKNKNAVVGEVVDNVFRPNTEFKWTNEAEMMKGLSSQVWGEKGEDIDAFKGMLYDSAVAAGYKGSKDKFFNYKKPHGRPSSHGARMPEWYDWAVENGIELKQPSQVPIEDAQKYAGVSTARIGGVKKTKEGVISTVEKLDKRLDDVAAIGDIVTTYYPQAAPESGAGGYVRKEKQVVGYGTYADAKKDEEFLRRHIGHYADFMFGSEDAWIKTMQHHRRVYENLGGDQIMDVLAPNAVELERSKVRQAGIQFLMSLEFQEKEAKTRKSQIASELKLKERGLDIEERKLWFQNLWNNEELQLKKALAEDRYGQQTGDVANSLFDQGMKLLELVRKDYEGKNMSPDQLYATDYRFQLGTNRLLQAEALMNGVKPSDLEKYMTFASRQPGGLLGAVSGFTNSIAQIWRGPSSYKGIPQYGSAQPYTQAEQEQQMSIEKQKEEEAQISEEIKGW